MPSSNEHKRAPGRVRNLLCSLLLLQAGTAAAIGVGQVDTFSDGTLQGWAMGRPTITATHVFNIADGGPTGAGDNYLEIRADGTGVAGGWITTFNQAQWTGDYLATGVAAIAMDVKNFGSSAPLNLRLGIEGGPDAITGGLFATSASVSLASGSDWTHVVFSLNPANLVPVSGNSGVTGNDVLAALGNVLELRLISSPSPAWSGVPVVAQLGVDNIQVQTVPLPGAAWLFGSGLAGLGLLRRRRG